MDEAEYVERAKARIREVLASEHAVVRLELEARISEAGYRHSGLNIDPHHITTAFTELRHRGEIIQTEPEASRGLHAVETIQPADQRRRKTAIAKAAARRRLLYGRYLGWANSTKRNSHGLIGPAGERAVRSGLLESATLVPARPEAGEVKRLLNVNLPGSLDSAGYLVPLVNGIPSQPVTVLIEVKNIRSHIYPSSTEPYQLLNKACILQQAQPDQPILPILVCRKAHQTSYWMARQLGFMIIEMEYQFAGAVDEEALHEVRTELHFQDLRPGAGPSLRVRDRFRDTIPQYAADYAAAWQKTSANPDLARSIQQLKDTRSRHKRSQLLATFREHVKQAGHQGF